VAPDNGRIPADDGAEGEAVDRCACGRIATARCWLDDSSPGRWLFACSRLPPGTPAAA
jgi:hypothetical protein